MPTYITDIIIAFVGILLGSGVTAFITLRKLKSEVSILDAEAKRVDAETDKAQAAADEVLAQAMKTQAEAWKTQAEAWKMLSESLGERVIVLSQRTNDQDKEIAALRCEIDQIKEGRRSTMEENEKLKARVIELEREVERIPVLETEIENLRQQIIQLGGKPKTGPLGKGKGGAPC